MSRKWIILDWNLRGINSQLRWNDIRQNIEESNCNILCFQETKRENFDLSYIKKIAPRRFDQFIHSPSIGSSGGLIIIWNSHFFRGQQISISRYHITVEFSCNISGHIWYLTNVYGPNQPDERSLFINWLLNLDSSPMDNWIIMGDFNLVRGPENRNRPGGDVNNMIAFNRLISHHDLVEIPLKGRAFTWSNMQNPPLL